MEKSSLRRKYHQFDLGKAWTQHALKTFCKGLVLLWNLDEDLRFLVLLHLQSFHEKVDVDEVDGDDVDFADAADKVGVGRPRRQVQGAPHELELEAEPLSLSTLVNYFRLFY